MKINVHTPFAGTILVIKDGAPLGMVQEIDTEAKSYLKLKTPAWGHVSADRPEIERGTYDEVILCPAEGNVPEEFVQRFREGGVEILSTDEMDARRREAGVLR